MGTGQFIVRKLLHGIPLLLGVTFVAFLLMVYFGPDLTYEKLSKNPTAEEIREVRQQLGYDQPFVLRYGLFLKQLVTLDFGLSLVKDRNVLSLMAESIPVSMLLILPGFVLGNLLAIALALLAVHHRGRWPDKLIMTASVLGMSISFLVVMIAFQILIASSYGLNLFPVRGWEVHDALGRFDWWQYLRHVTVPTLATVFVSLGYNTRFFRSVMVEEAGKDHIRTARAYGCKPTSILFRGVLKNAMTQISTRILYSVPMIVVSGSLLLESYFGIPGIGLVTYDAIVAGDQPVIKAVVSLTAVLFVLVMIVSDLLYRTFDPRIALQ